MKNSDLFPLPDLLLIPYVQSALREDLGRRGDITSAAVLPPNRSASLKIVTRDEGVIAGLDLARITFHQLDPTIQFRALVQDGTVQAAGSVLAEVSGDIQNLLTAERTALNFLTHLSGIATQVAKVVASVAHTKAEITCTRKTIPGLRALQKYAVRAGGGRNHRLGLDDAILIKDNHIALAGGIKPALERAKEAAGHLIPLEIEVDTLAQLEEVLAIGVDLILLDNMDPETLKEAVLLTGDLARTEASGGITPENVVRIAETGVDFIAMGSLTHTAPALDIGFDVDLAL